MASLMRVGIETPTTWAEVLDAAAKIKEAGVVDVGLVTEPKRDQEP